MDQPLGRAVGNSLEIIESIEALKGQGPADIMEVTYALGCCMLRAAGREIAYAEGARNVPGGRSPRAGPWTFSGASSPPREATPRVCDDYSLLPAGRGGGRIHAPVSGFIEAHRRFRGRAWPPSTPAPAAGEKEDAVGLRKRVRFPRQGRRQGREGPGTARHRPQRPPRSDCRPSWSAWPAPSGSAPEPVAAPKMILHLVDKDGVHPWPY